MYATAFRDKTKVVGAETTNATWAPSQSYRCSHFTKRKGVSWSDLIVEYSVINASFTSIDMGQNIW